MPVLLFSVIAHEYAHGYAALKQGDTTALMLGRLTWNPIKHIDPFMTILLPAMLFIGSGGTMMFGGAKPVPVESGKLSQLQARRHHRLARRRVREFAHRARARVSLFILVGVIGRAAPVLDREARHRAGDDVHGVRLNLLLIAFNLIPIPPLDGSHVMKYLLPPSLGRCSTSSSGDSGCSFSS